MNATKEVSLKNIFRNINTLRIDECSMVKESVVSFCCYNLLIFYIGTYLETLKRQAFLSTTRDRINNEMKWSITHGRISLLLRVMLIYIFDCIIICIADKTLLREYQRSNTGLRVSRDTGILDLRQYYALTFCVKKYSKNNDNNNNNNNSNNWTKNRNIRLCVSYNIRSRSRQYYCAIIR